jgi:oligopeptide/dipeptide ABC transporter ATP-binding protein
MLFIAHDLAVVKNVSDRVAVMYLGKMCEVARPDDLYLRPEHPYTEALLTAIPEPDPGATRNGRGPLAGDLPSPIDPPSGCRFRTRCPFAQQKCADEEPQMRAMGPDHFVACHFPLSTHPTSTSPVTVGVTAPPGPPSGPPAGTAPVDGPSAWSVRAPDATPPQPPSPPSPERSPLWVDP